MLYECIDICGVRIVYQNSLFLGRYIYKKTVVIACLVCRFIPWSLCSAFSDGQCSWPDFIACIFFDFLIYYLFGEKNYI